jgi:hypothetical protein
MEAYDVFRVISLVLVWGIPALLVVAVVVFIVLAPALTFGGMVRKLYERVFARRRKTIRQESVPTIGEILAAAGLTIQAETATGKPVAAEVFMQQPASELNKLLAKAGLSIQEEAIPKHCWEVLHCPPGKREACPAYARRDVPSWVAIGLGKGRRVSEVCVNSTLLDLKTLRVKT